VNLCFKFITPWLMDLRLSRAAEMVLGVALPLIMLAVYEFIIASRNAVSQDYLQYQAYRRQQQQRAAEDVAETEAIYRQNLFGLRVIAFALGFTALLLYVLGIIAATGNALVAGIATAILLAALVPLRAANRLKRRLQIETAGKAPSPPVVTNAG